ncbi:MAG: carboxypeptidase regulatory-like domain-containing protein [Chitinophagaceae bacterium]|nr:MAG: carboxypeptidase regulatory-like domain-containing protein [Chitinophagaceae bacterium]
MKLKILLLTLFFIAGCLYVQATGNHPKNTGPGKSDDEVNGSIVHGDSKKPLKDVTITAYTASKKEKYVVTDESGHFEFDDLKPGIYKLVFEKEGFKKITREKIVVKTDDPFQMNIEMFELSDFDLMPSPLYLMGTH